MEAVDNIHKKIGNFIGSVRMSQGNEMYILGELVDNDENAIELAGLRQAIDEVHGLHFPRC
jgi:hypothetical protein